MRTPASTRWKYKKASPYEQKRELESGWTAFAVAIIQQAVEDWKDADKLEKGKIKYSNTGIGSPKKTKYEIIKFFNSQWYGTLCDIDPHRILRKLGAE